ncbi:MAG: methyltransferase domain-containing protein [Lachnospiraceae bacterium]|nr:methyltransferase domain-containing protein [Lachnospiraceae bacterium]
MRPKGYYTSGEFAKMAHISVRTVRFYDKQNILKPSYVNETGARFYSDEDFVRLQQILLLKYLGFSLEDIRDMTVEDPDHQMLKNSLNLQLKLVKDRVEQMQMVAAAIEDIMKVIDTSQNIDWKQMLNLIHLTNMETSLKSQYQNANNIAARINLHKLFSTNKQGWFPWVYEHCGITEGMEILELGCGNGAIWKENYEKVPKNTHIVLNDISEGMLRDTRRELEQIECLQNGHYSMPQFDIRAFDCHEIPFENNSFDCIIANHVLFYCDDLTQVLCEVQRVLKQDGGFICSSYGAAHMQEITQLVKGFHSMITLSADKLYENFGMGNGEELLKPYFTQIERKMYEDSLLVDKAEPLIEYILSCHGNQNQYILERYKEFRSYVEKKTEKKFQITKEAGIFICRK